MLRLVPAIERMRIQGFGCIHDVDLYLGPLQAFIGPNDSGKSTILRAIRTVVDGLTKGEPQVVPGCQVGGLLEIEGGEDTYRLVCRTPDSLSEDEPFKSRLPFGVTRLSAFRLDSPLHQLQHGGAVMLRLNPEELRSPSYLIPEGKELSFFTERGAGLAGLFDALMYRSDRPIDTIVARVRERFATVKHIGLRNVSTTHKELQIELVDGVKVPASLASEGLLYYMAFATLPYLHRGASILLVEEPENGLHPARIRDVVDTLRDISRDTQVIIATHSPILVNELEAHEVFVTTRSPESGTRVTRLDHTHNFAERSRVYHPGELWVAYADGDAEGALLGEEAH